MAYMSASKSVSRFVELVYLLPVCLSLSVCLSVFLFVCLHMYISVYLGMSVCLFYLLINLLFILYTAHMFLR